MKVQFYDNKRDFLASLTGKRKDYILRLNASMFTRYSISFNKTKQLYRVVSHVDDISSWYTEEELFDPTVTNFEKALDKNALGELISY